MLQSGPFHLLWRAPKGAADINVLLDHGRVGVRLGAVGCFVNGAHIIPWSALALDNIANVLSPDQQLKFRFNVKVIDPVPEVPYAGAFVGFSRNALYVPGSGAKNIYPLDYWRLSPDGAVEWGKVCGPDAWDQLPVSTVHCLDTGQDPVLAYRIDALWDFTCFVDPNEVEPGHVRMETVIVVAFMGRYVGTWRSLDDRPLRPIAYVEGAVLEQQVLVGYEEVSRE